MAITLTTGELTTLENMRAQATPGNYWPIYQWLAETLQAKGIASTDSTVLWLRGATEANAGRGALSALIRTYTETQYRLRYGSTLTTTQMQAASDEVAKNLLRDVLGENAPAWPRGQFPDIARIAFADATAVGDVLFGPNLSHDPNDTAFLQNSAWSGALLFSMLGSNQTGLLTSTGIAGSLDTLNDLRDVFYAAVSYANALPVANSSFWSGSAAQIATDTAVLGATVVGYFNSGHTSSDVWNTVFAGASGGAVGAAFQRIGEVGANRFLDMLMGAVQGRSLIGSTTDANLLSNANAFFGALTPAQLQILGASLLPTGAIALVSLALTDVNTRVALAALSVVSVQVSAAVAQRFSLYDPATGQGEITERWIADRALAQAAFIEYWKRGETDGVLSATNADFNSLLRLPQFAAATWWMKNLPVSRLGDLQVVIEGQTPAITQQLLIDGLDLGIVPTEYMYCGSDNADSRSGGTSGDRLYGGYGNDTLNGLGGNDYLEGNADDDSLNGNGGSDTLVGGAGNDVLDGGVDNDVLIGGIGTDTYSFTGTWGADTIEDTGGQGLITIENLGSLAPIANGSTKVAADAWQSAAQANNQRVYFSLVSIDATHNNLIVSFSDRTDTITIRNWANGDLGLTLPGTITPPVTTTTLTGDYDKQISAGNYVTDAHGYVAAGSLLDAPDVILGVSTAETLQGLGGNDGLFGDAGADLIEGGDGSDLLLGGTGADTINGGNGADFIYGSAVGGIDVPTNPSFTPPAIPAGTVEAARGFSWAAYRAPGQRITATTFTLFDVQAAGASLVVAYPDGQGGVLVESDGNIIDGGAGNDYIAAGTGADIVHGGADDDDILGMDDGDVLFGDAGVDIIYGDGSADPAKINSPSYTPASEHGSDIISGGSGNDYLVGQGGGDELYGGSEDDWLYGDDANLTDTPVALHGDDYLDGGDGADRLEGGGKDDQLYGGAGADRLWGDDSAGLLPLAYQGQDYLDGGADNDQLVGGGNADVLIGGAGNDTMLGDDVQSKVAVAAHGDDEMYGGDGNDLMVGGGANDWMEGGAGNDQMQGDDLGNNVAVSAHGKDFLDGGTGDDTLIGGGSDDELFGGDGFDFLRGDDIIVNVAASAHGNDWLDGGAGGDTMFGDGGADTLHGGDGNDWLAGEDQQSTSATSTLTGDDALYGDAGDDTLVAGNGNDFLDGGIGNDVLAGGDGDDTYVYGHGAGFDNIRGSAAGFDRILLDAGVSPSELILGRNAANLYLALDGGQGQMVVEGFFTGANDEIDSVEFNDGTVWATPDILNNTANLVFGTTGNDTFIADGARSIMAGGTGYDRYRVDNVGDLVWEVNEAPPVDAFGVTIWAQSDIVESSVSYTLPDYVERIVVSGSAAVTLTGNSGSNYLSGGNGAANVLRGGAGNDYYSLGNGDSIVEAAGEGYDDMGYYTPVLNTFVMWDNVEKGFIWKFDGSSLNVTGNSSDNWFAVQTSGSFGLPEETPGGSDVIRGGAGNDELYGLSRNTTYLYDLGDGRDTVYEYDLTINTGFGNWAGDRVLFGTGITQADLQIQWQGQDLWIGVGGAGDGILVNQFVQGYQRGPLEYLQFADGSILDLMPWFASQYYSWAITAGDDTIVGGAGIDLIFSQGGNDNLSGLAGNDFLNGGDGNDTLNGGVGNDNLIGGTGNDTYVVDAIGDFVGERVNEGTDTVQSSISWTLGGDLENLTLTGSALISGTGNALDNMLTGNSANNTLAGGAGNDTLNGGTGNDTMLGGLGNDTYVVNVATDIVTEFANEGIDTVQSSATYTLLAEIENLTLTGSTAINGTGNTLNNVLTGNSAANILTGGAGDDTYVVGTGDTTTEAASAGTDTVLSSVTWTLATNLENLTLTGSAAINGTGNAVANVLTGNSGNNALNGGTGADTMIGGAGNDTYTVDNALDVITELANEGTDAVSSSVTYTLAANLENLTLSGTTAINATGNTQDNVLTGNSANNTLTGLAGNDTLNGGTGNDTMLGGAGNDTYVVNIATDVVTELANEGTDTVQSSVTLTLANNVENLTLTGTSTLSGTGNTLDNVLIGTSGNNTLTGLGGNDTLDGGLGNDTMLGGAGNDTYVVNVATDVVTELANEGTDTVQSVVTLTLAANVENLTLTGSTAINGTGNTLNNVLIGNSGSNVLSGAAGDDTYDGASGNDTFTDTSTTSNETYRWGNGSGLDVLTDSGGTLDHVDLFAGITSSQLQFAHVGNNLELSLLGDALDKLTINGWYTSSSNQIEEFRLSDGSKVLASQVDSLISAMAVFTAGAGVAGPTMTILPVRFGAELANPAVA